MGIFHFQGFMQILFTKRQSNFIVSRRNHGRIYARTSGKSKNGMDRG